jgi:hypothetical protein
MSFWFWLGTAVLVASVWHPFRAETRTAAHVAGLRLGGMFVLLLALWFLPSLLFDPGPRDGTDTCPYFIVGHSQAWWAEVVLFGCILWSGVGVLKAGGVSVIHHESASSVSSGPP